MLVIRGAQRYNPAQGTQAQIGDLWVDGERIIPPPQQAGDVEVIDAHGKIVAPAGIEIHTHVAGYPLNAARRFLLANPDHAQGLLPTPQAAAERYLRMGYTTVFDAAMSPLFARHTQYDLNQMTQLDRGTYTQIGDYRQMMTALAVGDIAYVRDLIAWLVRITGGYAVKLVNPGGGLAWKSGQRGIGLDDPFGVGELTQRKALVELVSLVNEMGMPHPAHLHACRLGVPGNHASFCETVKALEGQRCHLCHIQFYSYGEHHSGGYSSAAEKIVDCITPYPALTFDVGQVMFGKAMGITHDTSALSNLQRASSHAWISYQIEGEGGNNIMPLDYSAQDPTGAVQWATGLELLLRFPDPLRLFLTTDHPNGAPFDSYPQIIAWLMDRSARLKALKNVHPAADKRSGLAGITREYSLGEIFAMTSLGPARALGLTDRGTLEPGALADLRCYSPRTDIREMFTHPDWVMRHGKMVVQGDKIIQNGDGAHLTVHPGFDQERLSILQRDLSNWVSLPARAYALDDDELAGMKEVACTSKTS
ncbi:MAG: formylmethanofuran dehydrogenase subunit A [Anaerolineae bacterium]|nr:formylmethanofuran dehydrogenase subunit A [Anaerolineae bacterium]